MAAALTAYLSGGKVKGRSAGTVPAGELNPVVVEAMAELGIDLSAESPSLLQDDLLAEADVIVTMGCGDTCPIFPGKRYLDWKVADPAGQPLPVVRRIRNQIRRRVEALLTDLNASMAQGRW